MKYANTVLIKFNTRRKIREIFTVRYVIIEINPINLLIFIERRFQFLAFIYGLKATIGPL